MRTILFCVLAFTATMCKSSEQLSIPKQDFIGNSLKLDGYYYSINDGYLNAFFIYKNGIYHGGNWQSPITFDPNNYDSLDKKVDSIFSFEKKYPTQYRWGVFKVTDSQIVIERWVTASGGGTYPTQMLKGVIKNDTTIHFHTLVGAHPVNYNSKKKVLQIDETYHFRPFSPKPDSPNTFIK